MTTKTRRATSTDIPVLVELMHEFYAESDYPLDRQWAGACFSALLANDSLGCAWVILADSEPIGFVVLTVRFSMEFGAMVAFIDDLFIRPDFRRRGFGRAALKALLTECRKRKVCAVHVEVGRDNQPAQLLYALYGLKPGEDNRQLLTALLEINS
jgi:GNAT superfamily N-acetyltransferase